MIQYFRDIRLFLVLLVSILVSTILTAADEVKEMNRLLDEGKYSIPGRYWAAPTNYYFLTQEQYIPVSNGYAVGTVTTVVAPNVDIRIPGAELWHTNNQWQVVLVDTNALLQSLNIKVEAKRLPQLRQQTMSNKELARDDISVITEIGSLEEQLRYLDTTAVELIKRLEPVLVEPDSEALLSPEMVLEDLGGPPSKLVLHVRNLRHGALVTTSRLQELLSQLQL